MGERTIVKYSIVRYVADYIANEVINVGLIFHVFDKTAPFMKFHLIDENSSKLKSIVYNNVGIREYKSYKDLIDYYLNESSKNLLGFVGEISCGAYLDSSFLDKIKENLLTEKMYLTEIATAMTSNVDQLFRTIYDTYVGSQYYPITEEKIAVKQYVHQYLKEKNLLNTKVLYNYDFHPIKELSDLKFRVDFKFSNTVDNFMISAPNAGNSSNLNEWFAKTKLMFDSLQDESKLYLLYNKELVDRNNTLQEYFNFLSEKRHNVEQLNIDNSIEMDTLCDQIDSTAKNFSETA